MKSEALFSQWLLFLAKHDSVLGHWERVRGTGFAGLADLEGWAVNDKSEATLLALTLEVSVNRQLFTEYLLWPSSVPGTEIPRCMRQCLPESSD